MWTIPVPDIHRTDLLVVMGANPHASQGWLLACPDVLGEIDAHPRARRQGRRDRPAPHRHRRARPTSGCRSRPAPTPRCCWRSRNVLFAEGLVDLGHRRRPRRRRRRGRGASCADFTPERVARRDRHPRRAHPAPRARARRAPSGRSSTAASALCNQEFGTLASWLVDVVNILTGNFDAPGGADVPATRRRGRVTDLPMPGLEGGVPKFGRWTSRGARRARGARPGAGVVPGRGDRHAGRGPDPGADHDRRQPGAVDARAATGSTPRSPSSSA